MAFCHVVWRVSRYIPSDLQSLHTNRSKKVNSEAFGVAVRRPERDVDSYTIRRERTVDNYSPLCVNCHRLMSQIVRWGGQSTDVIVENFSVEKWERRT